MSGVITRFLLPILFLAASFWPDYGLATFLWGQAPFHPYAVTIGVAFWAIVLCLILPLPVRVFRGASTILLTTALLAATTSLSLAGVLPSLTMQTGIIYVILVGGMILGWLMVSTRVWRFLHGIVAVEDQHV